MTDGVLEYKDDLVYWGALCVLDHIDTEDSSQFTEKYVKNILSIEGAGVYDFIRQSCEENALETPSESEIIKRVIELYNYS